MRLKTLVLVLGLLLFMPSAGVMAHELAKDGKISAFLHIEPDDQPQANKINTVHVYFNDQDFRFTMEGCYCNIKINQGKKVLYSGPLDSVGPRVGQTKVFLPQDNFSYDVAVSGTPKSAGFFQPFKLKFDIDVGKPPADEQQPEDGPNLLIRVIEASIIIAGIVGCIMLIKSIRMKR